MTEFESTKSSVVLGYAPNQARIVLQQIEVPVDRGTGFGRIAFACPGKQLPVIEKLMRDKNQTILTPFVSLETPGKATVQVVILADPVTMIFYEFVKL